MKLKQRKLQYNIPVYLLLPNIVTLIALSLGMTSIRYALDSKWSIVALLIVCAALLDAIDGRIARLLNATSKFGAHLDSLSDLVSFGVAPAFAMYLWTLQDIPFRGVAWVGVLLFVACSAIRLARFNVLAEEKTSTQKNKDYFVGMPMPAGGFLCILPMITSFEIIDGNFSPWIILIYMVIIGLLMISRLPTPSLKTVSIPRKYAPILMVGVVLVIAFLIMEPWKVFPIIGMIYLISLPFYIYAHYKSEKAA